MVEACDLVKSSGSGAWIAPSLSSSETDWWIGDPLSELEEGSAWASGIAVAASRAAREDAAYVNLRDVTADLAAMRSAVVHWARGNPAKQSQLLTLRTTDPFYRSAVEMEARLVDSSPNYNDLLQSWRIECNAAADALNG